METIRFTKMEGCGNDYIYIEDLDQKFRDGSELSSVLSDRHFGVGGDGVIFIHPSDCADAKMTMYNEDGSEGKMCGNGIRCVAKYLHDHGIVDSHTMSIETLSGIKKVDLVFVGDEVVGASVDMGEANLTPKSIPALLEGKQIIDRPVKIGDRIYNITCVSMGNPHCIVFVDDVNEIDIDSIGPQFEFSPLFPERINTEFVHVIDDTHLQMRVWERGAGETLACGTGACASVVAACENGFCHRNKTIQVSIKGGDLQIQYSNNHVFMQGPAKTVFDGTINVDMPADN